RPTRAADEFRESCIEARDGVRNTYVKVYFCIPAHNAFHFAVHLVLQKEPDSESHSQATELRKPQQRVLNSSERRYVTLGCVLSFLFPAVIVVISIAFLMTDTEAHKGIYEKFFHIRNMSNSSKTLYGILSTLLQTLFTLHYFVFPALIMTLLSFVYSSYSNILKLRLSDIRQDLLKDMTQSVLSETLKILLQLKNTQFC
ncbi:hypothetical protein TNCT_544891, partial [Trichonephila clavata]